MSTDTRTVTIRMHPALFERLERLARREKRSISGQINLLVEAYFDGSFPGLQPRPEFH